MKTAKKYKKFLAGFMACALALIMGAGVSAITVHAASGSVYTCTVHPCYQHPVTGEIEDSGGEDSYAIGQGMVEGCVASTGLLEVADNGAYYLTIRMGLMDDTSGHSFLVQNVGDSGWSAPGVSVTGSGSDSNGTTNDICIQVPSENCVVRISMYVSPMGRDVIFYLYLSDFNEGNHTDMTATMVTEESGSNDSDNQATSGQEENIQEVTGDQQNDQEASENKNNTEKSSSSDKNKTKKKTDATKENKKENDDKDSKKLESSIEAVTPEAQEMPSTDSSTLDSAKGLTLSTADETTDAGTGDAEKNSEENEKHRISMLQITIAVLVVGVLLIGGVSGVAYLKKNGKLRGGAPDDEE